MSTIVYFSHQGETLLEGRHQQVSFGNTEVVAKTIAKKLNYDLIKLIPEAPYAIDYQTTLARAKLELQDDSLPEISSVKHNFQADDEIFLGYPIWWGTLPMVIKTFLKQVDLSEKKLYPFCTHEGSGFGRSLQDLSKLLPETEIQKGLAIRGSRVTCAQCAVDNWLCQKIQTNKLGGHENGN